MERDNYLLELCRYVVLNPARANMVEQPEQYPWSSYRATAGFEIPPPFLTLEWILGQFGQKRVEAQSAYRRFVLVGTKRSSPWEELKAQCILGSRKFIEKIKPALKNKSMLTEIPKRERFVFRPSLDQLLSEGRWKDKEGRNEAIVSAHLEYGYSLSEIARDLGLHYTTISKIVKQGLSQN